MKIKYNLFQKRKVPRKSLRVEIDLYPYASELYEELDKIGIIKRIKNVPQLGVIKVKKKLVKTRLDYVILQLYLHKLIKTNLQSDLRYSYNNYINSKEFRNDYNYLNNKNKPTMGDILQLLTIVYNIGHFYNTFTSSRAVVMLAKEDNRFYNLIINASSDKRYQDIATSLLTNKNYQRLHLLNSILVLEQCDKTKQAVSVALEILYAYINEELLLEDSKLKYAFTLFRNIRTTSYISYDLQIAKTPLTMDLCDEKAILIFLKELLSEYNNNQSSTYLVSSVTKLLNDTVYNENSSAICYYKISRKMTKQLSKVSDYSNINYYNDLLIDKDSILNSSYSHKRDYIQTHILKLTFSLNQRHISEKLLSDLEKINNTRVGYYDRYSGDQTILVSIRSSCTSDAKRLAAYKTLKYVVGYLRRIPNISSNDKRFLLTVKFFLFYLFDENPILIKPTINRDTCVICTRGKNRRINELQSLLNTSIGNSDENHEVDFLLSQISNDSTNDTTITIPSSIIVYQKNAVGKKLSEFDGLIIYPTRKLNQIIFLEAKNRDRQPSFGKKCLIEKFNKFSFKYKSEDVEIINYDACFKYSIK